MKYRKVTRKLRTTRPERIEIKSMTWAEVQSMIKGQGGPRV